MAFERTGEQVYRSLALSGLGWVVHAFGTRHNEAPAGRRVTLRQVHSDIVVRAGGGGDGVLGQGDALITREPGLRLVIRTADCVPVLLADPESRAVAAIHAGWRGTAAEIVPKTIARMGAEFGSRPGQLLVAVGPAIAACCYQVSADVSQRFRQWLPELPEEDGPVMLDLHLANRRQLEAAGVRQISVAALCTRCGAEEFHSFRRDGDRAGRMESWIGVEPGG